MNQKLSIITINYNNLEGLKRTLKSVVNQTWQEFEFVVIDGGSTDGSAEYIKSKNEFIDYWISEPDKGIYDAMNKGIAIASGDYLLFLNSGDHFFNNEALEENFQDFKTYDLIYFNVNIIGELTSEIITHPDKLLFSYFYSSGLNHQSVLIKKELFGTVGFYDEYLNIVSDWKFFTLALFVHNCSYLNIKKTLTSYYLDGISSKLSHSFERNKVMNEYFSGFILDYEELLINRKLLKMNRFKMLYEIEKSRLGKKIVSVFFRLVIVLFIKKKLNKILC